MRSAERLWCLQDEAWHLEQIQQYADAGFDELYVANMGPHHQEMIEFYGSKVLAQLP